MNHLIAESQDCIHQLLRELKSTNTGTESQPNYLDDLLSHLRPHCWFIAHIASHLELPTDKWPAFVHYME
jgi:hypothetical protein